MDQQQNNRLRSVRIKQHVKAASPCSWRRGCRSRVFTDRRSVLSPVSSLRTSHSSDGRQQPVQTAEASLVLLSSCFPAEQTLSSTNCVYQEWAPLSPSAQVLLALRWHLSRSLSCFGSCAGIWGFNRGGVLTGGTHRVVFVPRGAGSVTPGSTWSYLILPGVQIND